MLMLSQLPKIHVALTLDVEEEGLFTGRYDCRTPSVRNLEFLRHLDSFLERGIRPTLFCAYSVLTSSNGRKILDAARKHAGVEIGAHLHHWNTPPLACDDHGESPRIILNAASRLVSVEKFAQKLDVLFTCLTDFMGEKVRSFRMGRWDLHKEHWPLLLERGIETDASVRPLHCSSPAGMAPDHFDAPPDPYWIDKNNLLEVPLTVQPLTPLLRHLKKAPLLGQTLAARLHKWGALALVPVHQPLWLLKFATRIHIARGGQTLSLTWHSSEMMPGGAPYLPDQRHVDKFLQKMLAYFEWLESVYNVSYVNMKEMREIYAMKAMTPAMGAGDWRLPARSDEEQAA